MNAKAIYKRHRRHFGAGEQDESVIGQRARFHLRVQACQRDGLVALYVWSRDCDCCESDHMSLVKASPNRLARQIDDIYEHAEGPVVTAVLPPEQHRDFVPTRRDAAMEAFEDGHSHCILGGSPRF